MIPAVVILPSASDPFPRTGDAFSLGAHDFARPHGPFALAARTFGCGALQFDTAARAFPLDSGDFSRAYGDFSFAPGYFVRAAAHFSAARRAIPPAPCGIQQMCIMFALRLSTMIPRAGAFCTTGVAFARAVAEFGRRTLAFLMADRDFVSRGIIW